MGPRAKPAYAHDGATVKDRSRNPPQIDQSYKRARLPYGGPLTSRDPRRQPDVPLLIVAYRMLGLVARGLNQHVRVVAWEHPWVRSFRPDGQTRLRHARLPAAAVLVLEDETMRAAQLVHVVLLPRL